MRTGFTLEDFSNDRRGFSRTLDALDRALSEGVAPGMVVGIWRKSDPSTFLAAACGYTRSHPTLGRPVTLDTIYDLASLTKLLSGWALSATLIDRGWLAFDTPLDALLPRKQFQGITIRHLLSHTAGLIWWVPLWEELRRAFAPLPLESAPIAQRRALARELLLAMKPERRPGEQAVYSDVSFLLLGLALEEASGMRLEHAVGSLVWNRLGIGGLHYRPVDRGSAAARDEAVAATEDSLWRGGVLQGQVHDDNCWAIGGVAPHAGVFGTVSDILAFARSLFHGAISRATLEESWRRVDSPPGCERTPGWDTPAGERPSAGRFFQQDSVGHLGFTGTSLWIDRRAGIAVTVLCNRVHPSRESVGIREFRPRIHDAIREDLSRI